MSILTHQGVTPRIADDARIAPNAAIVGDVIIGAGCSIGFNAVVVAESGPIHIGSHCVIMDGAILRGTAKDPLTVGNHCLVGPHASLVGCTLADDVFVATNATIFNAARLGARCEVQVNGIVHLRTRLEDDTVVPLGWIAVGDPAIIRPPSAHDEIWEVQQRLDFPGYVFGAKRPSKGETFMPHVMPRYASALRRWHSEDQPGEAREDRQD
ncbi:MULTISPECIES: gamma carbonic anhydrase family protein [unclassified Sinorhizobium]|uniref:gamma carbonic anhydrase family protein n=1 Tax=unclassified Sinorhizobium TaxID=2613772 RepID=UPI0035264D21